MSDSLRQQRGESCRGVQRRHRLPQHPRGCSVGDDRGHGRSDPHCTGKSGRGPRRRERDHRSRRRRRRQPGRRGVPRGSHDDPQVAAQVAQPVRRRRRLRGPAWLSCTRASWFAPRTGSGSPRRRAAARTAIPSARTGFSSDTSPVSGMAAAATRVGIAASATRRPTGRRSAVMHRFGWAGPRCEYLHHETATMAVEQIVGIRLRGHDWRSYTPCAAFPQEGNK